MENMVGRPSPEDAAAALADAEDSRTHLAHRLVLPSFFYGSIGAAVAGQIATTSLGVADLGNWARWLLLVGGLVVFALVAGTQLVRFRRTNGVWVGGLASRVVAGTDILASVSYGLALGGAIWAALDGIWWLVALTSLAGGLAYALSGRRWVRSYRAEPAEHSRGESAAWLAVLVVAVVAGLVLLVIGS